MSLALSGGAAKRIARAGSCTLVLANYEPAPQSRPSRYGSRQIDRGVPATRATSSLLLAQRAAESQRRRSRRGPGTFGSSLLFVRRPMPVCHLADSSFRLDVALSALHAEVMFVFVERTELIFSSSRDRETNRVSCQRISGLVSCKSVADDADAS
jgi:hypothetical protein